MLRPGNGTINVMPYELTRHLRNSPRNVHYYYKTIRSSLISSSTGFTLDLRRRISSAFHVWFYHGVYRKGACLLLLPCISGASLLSLFSRILWSNWRFRCSSLWIIVDFYSRVIGEGADAPGWPGNPFWSPGSISPLTLIFPHGPSR